MKGSGQRGKENQGLVQKAAVDEGRVQGIILVYWCKFLWKGVNVVVPESKRYNKTQQPRGPEFDPSADRHPWGQAKEQQRAGLQTVSIGRWLTVLRVCRCGAF